MNVLKMWLVKEDNPESTSNRKMYKENSVKLVLADMGQPPYGYFSLVIIKFIIHLVIHTFY